MLYTLKLLMWENSLNAKSYSYSSGGSKNSSCTHAVQLSSPPMPMMKASRFRDRNERRKWQREEAFVAWVRSSVVCNCAEKLNGRELVMRTEGTSFCATVLASYSTASC